MAPGSRGGRFRLARGPLSGRGLSMPRSFVDQLGWVVKTDNLAATLERAYRYACAQSQRLVTVEHLLLALTEDPDASAVLAACGIEITGLRQDVSDFISRQNDRFAPGEDGTPSAADDTRKIMEYASAAAEQSGRPRVNGAIVLAALIGEGRSPAAELLKSRGLTFEVAIKSLRARPLDAASTDVAGTENAGEAGAGLKPPPAGASAGSAPSAPPISPPPSAASAPPLSEPAGPVPPEPTAMEPPPVPASEPWPASASPEAVGAPAGPSEGEHGGSPFDKRLTFEPLDLATDAPSGPADQAGGPEDGLASFRRSEGDPAREPRHVDAPADAVPPSPSPGAGPRGEPGDGAPRARHAPPPGEGAGAPAAAREPSGAPPPRRPAAPPPPHPQHAPASRPAGVGAGAGTGDRSEPLAPPPLGAPPPGAPLPREAPRGRPAPHPGTAAPPSPAPSPAPPSAPYPAPAGGRGAPPPPRHPVRGRPGRANAADAPLSPRTPAPDASPEVEAGLLVENIPRRMRVAIPEVVEVRIARKDAENLSDGMRGVGTPQTHGVFVTKAMTVRLRAPEGGFWIEPGSPETQWIDNTLGLLQDDFASWRWTVTPQMRGKARLQLVVSARSVGADGVAAETALPDQVITVKVRTNYALAARKAGGWVAAMAVGGMLGNFGGDIYGFVMRLLTGP